MSHGSTKRICQLYAITPDDLTPEVLLRHISQALKGNVRWVQYRNKRIQPDAAMQHANELRQVVKQCHATGARLIVNDHLELALAIGADGVHMGETDGDLADARAALGPSRILGASCYNSLDCAERAIAAGADYIAFGALFPSATKPQARHAPLSLIQTARQRWPNQLICGIGGITLDNAPLAKEAGADLLAVISDLFSAEDICARALAYEAALV